MSPHGHDRWDARLKNWALWKHGVTADSGVSDAYRSGGNWEWWKHPPPPPKPLIGEAIDTDRLVRQLADDHQGALTAHYVWTYPETLDARAAELGITRKTLHNRTVAARESLEELDAKRRLSAKRILANVSSAPKYIAGNV